jgi:hypothetical protein
MNGSTFFDRTNYFETFTASDENLDWALSMEADRMVNSFIAKKDLDTEMTVVRNEFENWENNPQRVLWGRLQASAFDWHNYGNLTIGARSDIENVDIARLQAFYRLYYQPDNAVLVIAGRFDPERTLVQIAKSFGPIPRSTRPLPALYTKEPVQDGERVVTIRRVGGTQFVAALYHGVPGAHPDAIALDALGEVMTVEPAGRLYKALVEAKKATAVESWLLSLADPGNIIFWAQVPVNDPLDTARDALLATLENVRAHAIDFGLGDGTRESRHRGRSRPRACEGTAAFRRDVQRPAKAGRRDVRVDRAGRLAAFLPAARPLAQSDRGGCAARGARIPETLQPDAGPVHSRREAGPRASAAGRRYRRDGQGL